MEDTEIIALFFSRSERAIYETKQRYGAYLMGIANNLLHNQQDSEEVVSDCYLRAWNSIPPTKPNVLRHFLSHITRNLAIDRLKYRHAESRNSDLLEELKECFTNGDDATHQAVEEKELGESLNHFLSTLEREECALFLARYYDGESIKAMAKHYALTERQVKYRLALCRSKCKEFFMREGITL